MIWIDTTTVTTTSTTVPTTTLSSSSTIIAETTPTTTTTADGDAGTTMMTTATTKVISNTTSSSSYHPSSPPRRYRRRRLYRLPSLGGCCDPYDGNDVGYHDDPPPRIRVMTKPSLPNVITMLLHIICVIIIIITIKDDDPTSSSSRRPIIVMPFIGMATGYVWSSSPKISFAITTRLQQQQQQRIQAAACHKIAFLVQHDRPHTLTMRNSHPPTIAIADNDDDEEEDEQNIDRKSKEDDEKLVWKQQQFEQQQQQQSQQLSSSSSSSSLPLSTTSSIIGMSSSLPQPQQAQAAQAATAVVIESSDDESRHDDKKKNIDISHIIHDWMVSYMISPLIQWFTQLSLYDYQWRMDLFATYAAEHDMDVSIATIMGDNATYVRPMDAPNIGPLGQLEQSFVSLLLSIYQEEYDRAQRMMRQSGKIIRPMEASSGGGERSDAQSIPLTDEDDCMPSSATTTTSSSSSSSLGPMGYLEQRTVLWIQSIQRSEQYRMATKTNRPKDIVPTSLRGPLGELEYSITSFISQCMESELLRYQLQNRLRNQTKNPFVYIRPIDVPGPLGEFEQNIGSVFVAERKRIAQDLYLRPKDAMIQGPLGQVEETISTTLSQLQQEEMARLYNLQKRLLTLRPMENDRNSLLGQIEYIIVQMIRGPMLLYHVVLRIKELLWDVQYIDPNDATVLLYQQQMQKRESKQQQNQKKNQPSDDDDDDDDNVEK